MKTSPKTLLGFVLASILIVLVVISSLHSTIKFIDDSQWTLRTVELRSQVERLSTLYMTAQNNLRTYHATNQEHYLNLYNKAAGEMQSALGALSTSTADDAVQKEMFVQIESKISVKLAAWNRSFELRKNGGWKAILQRLLGHETKDQDQDLFNAIEAFKRNEDQRYQEHIRRAQAQGRYVIWIVSLGGLFACILIAVAGWIVYRDNRRREIAEAHMDRFFTLSLDLLCISGMDGYFKRLSPSYESALGYSLNELYSHPITDFIHPDDIDRTNAEIQSQMAGNKVLAFENRFRRKDGTYLIFSWKSVPVGNYMYAVARDVTNQKQYETDLMEAREAAYNADIAKTEFLANMSHEIRTPLNGVVGMTDLLARTDLNSNQNSFVGGIRSSAQHLLKIVNEILDFSKIEAGRTQVEHVDFDLHHVVENQVSLIGVLASEKGLRLETHFDSKIPRTLKGDTAKLGQILLNLLNNAVKFTEKGRIQIRVEEQNRTQDKIDVKFSVQDSGIGLNPEQVQRLFEPFQQADSSTARRFGGTGLGLSISKKLVEILKGQIHVDSTPGQGSTFWFQLPLEISDSPETTNSRHPLPLAPATAEQIAQRKDFRILVAEDNLVNQLVIMKMLAALGYTATLTKNGEEAVRSFAENKFELVLMDQHMPVMDGIEASHQIRTLERVQKSGHTPIIAFTATVVQEAQKLQQAKLMDDYILKPVTLETLEATLTHWENKVRTQEANKA